MKYTRDDFKILPIEIYWDIDGTYYEFWIERRIWYFFKLCKSNNFKLLLNISGDSPLSFTTEEKAEEYINTLINK